MACDDGRQACIDNIAMSVQHKKAAFDCRCYGRRYVLEKFLRSVSNAARRADHQLLNSLLSPLDVTGALRLRKCSSHVQLHSITCSSSSTLQAPVFTIDEKFNLYDILQLPPCLFLASGARYAPLVPLFFLPFTSSPGATCQQVSL